MTFIISFLTIAALVLFDLLSPIAIFVAAAAVVAGALIMIATVGNLLTHAISSENT